MYDPVDDPHHPEEADRRRDRAGLPRGRRQARRPTRLVELLQDRGARAGDHLLPDQDRRRRLDKTLRDNGPRRQGPARRHEPGLARRGDDRLQGPPRPAARRHRHRRPRARHRARHPRHQLRRARHLRDLRAPHRPHRPGRPHRPRDHPRHPGPAQGDRPHRARREDAIGEWETPEERLEHAPPPRASASERERAGRRAGRGQAEGDAEGDGDSDTKLFVNRGERSGISEEDLRWALHEGAVVPEEAIQDVRVLHRFSFVELDAEQAERAVELLDGTKLKGQEIRLEVARS